MACSTKAVRDLAERQRVSRRADAAAVAQIILGRSRSIVELRAEILALASGPVRSFLVLGETGVGKDLVPVAYHRSARHLSGRLVVFNCPAVPPDHLESELFGTTRGAYTGAVDRPGAVERASGGTLVLDEIGAMPMAHQAKILRLLENGEACRLGDASPYRVDATFIAVTNEDLANAVGARLFREDLYYRLVQDAVVQVLPLRDRIEDVRVLAETFVAEHAPEAVLTDRAIERLEQHSWPGNVRELRAVVRGAVRLASRRSSTGIVGCEDVETALRRIPLEPRFAAAPRDLGSRLQQGRLPMAASPSSFQDSTAQLRRQLLIDALSAAHGNQTVAGVILGMHCRQGDLAADALDVRARKLAHRKFGYWWRKLVVENSGQP